MKMKKLVALGAAAAMSMAMCVNVLAESEVKTGAVDASYAGAKASYTGTFKDEEGNTLVAAKGTQMTVAVLKAIAQNADLKNEDIEYINQDVADSALYTNMGTKDDLLATDENGNAIYAGDYVIRVGFYDDKGIWHIEEGTFTIATKKTETGTKVTLSYGDVNGNGEIEPLDVSLLLQRSIGLVTAFKDTLNRTIPDKLGDVNANGEIEPLDVSLLLQKSIGLVTVFVDGSNNPLTEYTYTVSDTVSE